jgi:site-specific DNA-methyltransferase (adenine-specific)
MGAPSRSGFETEHVLRVGDAAAMTHLDDDSVPLVVTSPPYPMVAQWDDLFAARDDAVADALDAGAGERAFERMHEQLDAVWDEVCRVLAPGGVVCVNVGDATRSLDGQFRTYTNHSRIDRALRDRGLRSLPDVLWRKPTNSATKFMGSGTLPPNAYVTLEHEHLLLFRAGGPRSFPPGDARRYESAFFWEERNRWFSDLWEFPGTDQTVGDERVAAFPLELPLRVVRMYSVYGDTVLDPFAGTGTTTLAAMLAGRSSVGYDLAGDRLAVLDERLDDLPDRSERRARERLARHREFVADRDPGYEAENYDVGVTTKAERGIRLYRVDGVERTGTRPRRYRVGHAPLDG